jgi:hypothetical protein
MSQHTTDVITEATKKRATWNCSGEKRGIKRSLISVEAVRFKRARRFELGQNQCLNRIRDF